VGITDTVRGWQRGSTLAIWGASWAFNPKLTRGDFQDAYEKNEVTADRDYGAIPPKTVEKALRSMEAIDELCNRGRQSPINANGGFEPWFKGDPRFEYFYHVDMSKTNDPTGMGLCHYDSDADKVVVDLIHQIKPSKTWELSFSRIFQFILELRRLGFNLKKVTFDSWQSYHMKEQLINEGFEADFYSCDRGTEAYDTLISTLLSGRLDYYYHAVFIKEMQNLRLLGGTKYDHPEMNEDGTYGSKDTADGVAGCVTQCSKAMVGMMLKTEEVERAAIQTPCVEIAQENGLWEIHTDLKAVHPFERLRPRAARLDAHENRLLFCCGWQDKADNKLRADLFLEWEDYDQPQVFANVQFVLLNLFSHFRIEAFSLNEHVPIELINFLQQNGRNVSSALVTGIVPGKLTKTAPLQKKAVKLLVTQVKQGNILFVHQQNLLTDLQYMTSDNLDKRQYVSCLAGWVDFLSKESTFGVTSKPLPRATSGAPVGPPPPQMNPLRSQTPHLNNEREIERIRARYAVQQSGQAGQVPPLKSGIPGGRRLPRIPR
jgi:hypothetical protein